MELSTEEPELVYDKLILLDALELVVTLYDPDGSLELQFSWDIEEFTEDYIWIKVNFQNPTKVSEGLELDTLSITFWGVDYFKSKSNKEVEMGMTIFQSLPRQFSSNDEADQVYEFADS